MLNVVLIGELFIGNCFGIAIHNCFDGLMKVQYIGVAKVSDKRKAKVRTTSTSKIIIVNPTVTTVEQNLVASNGRNLVELVAVKCTTPVMEYDV